MAWETVRCPWCGGTAKKVPVNESISHNISHASCDKCHKRIVIEQKFSKVKAMKD